VLLLTTAGSGVAVRVPESASNIRLVEWVRLDEWVPAVTLSLLSLGESEDLTDGDDDALEVGRRCFGVCVGLASDFPEALPLASDTRADDEVVDLDVAVALSLRVRVTVAVADSEPLGVVPGERVAVGPASHANTRLPVDAASRATLAKC
jgi:hypothetical protein